MEINLRSKIKDQDRWEQKKGKKTVIYVKPGPKYETAHSAHIVE